MKKSSGGLTGEQLVRLSRHGRALLCGKGFARGVAHVRPRDHPIQVAIQLQARDEIDAAWQKPRKERIEQENKTVE